jgi:hypothetical protein
MNFGGLSGVFLVKLKHACCFVDKSHLNSFSLWKQPLVEIPRKAVYIRPKVVGPFSGPCAKGSYVQRGCPFKVFLFLFDYYTQLQWQFFSMCINLLFINLYSFPISFSSNVLHYHSFSVSSLVSPSCSTIP